MALGAHPNMTGLGEIYAVIKNRNHKNLFENSTCSCGKKGAECPFWKQVREIAESNKSVEIKYLQTLSVFYETFGEETILIDSSKNSYNYLKKLDTEYDLQIVYLTRDFRSWSYSRFIANKKPIFLQMIRWYLENKKLLSVLKKYNINYLPIGYEELALFPELTLGKISDYAGIPFSEKMLIPNNTKSHIITGNIARVDKMKKAGFYYDPKWLMSFRMNLISWIFSFFHKLNNKLVYSNIIQANKKDTTFIFGKKRKEELYKKHN